MQRTAGNEGIEICAHIPLLYVSDGSFLALALENSSIVLALICFASNGVTIIFFYFKLAFVIACSAGGDGYILQRSLVLGRSKIKKSWR